MDKVKNILSGSKNDENVATSGHTTSGGTSALHSGTTGHQTTGLTGEGSHLAANRNTVGSGTTTAGPHDSNLANKADPRVDSDLDGSRTVGNTGEVSNTTSAGTGYGTSTGTGTAHSGNTGYGGPHQTEAANKLDPSVNTSGGTGLESAHHHSKTHGGGAEQADTHHLGRDAAVGAGRAGLAEHEHHKHSNERESGLGGATGHPIGAYDSTTGTSTTGTGHQSHLGRDAGIGAAGVGTAGVAEHEHHKHQPGVTSDLPGPAPHTAGPHKQDWLNKLDPRVNANPDKPQSTGHGPLKVEEGHTGPAKPYDPTTGYVSNPHHHRVTDVNPDGSTTRHANLTHHGQTRTNDLPGHDAAAVGALGGAGAYEAGKHHHGTESGVGGTSATTTAGPHSSNLANKADPTVDSDRSKDHHYARDAGVAGGVGAGAYEADKHHQKHDKDLTESERAAKKDHKHELKEEKREHKDSKGGLLSFLHRDKNKKYTPEEEAEFDRQEREYNTHKGRDAVGGAAVGGAAYEAEKHHHDHQHTATDKPLPTVPGNHGIGTGAGTQNALTGDNTTSTSSGHHLGQDAAAVSGAAALGEHERSTHTGTHGATPLVEKPRGTDIGDELHGVERNRGVQGSTGFRDYGTGTSTTGTGVGSTTGTTGTSTTGQHHYGRDATAVGGAADLGEHEHRRHEHENLGSSGVGNQSSGITGSSTGTGNQHHLGRDAGVAAGGTGLAEHEHRKHEGVTRSQYDNASSGLTGSNTASSGLTGSNRGLGGNEYRKDDITGGQGYGTTGQQTGLTGHQSSGLTGTGSGYDSNVTGFNTTGGIGGDRNRLHKDPPAGHAATGRVPASGTETERLVGQGEERLVGDTGVANAHGQGVVNVASNY